MSRRVGSAVGALAILIVIAPIISGARPVWLVTDRQASMDALHPSGECAQAASTTNCPQPDVEAEPSIAINPANDRNAVTVFQVGRFDNGGAAAIGFATTWNAGSSWRYGILPGLTVASGGPIDRASDPVVAFGPNGSVYVVSLGINVTAPQSTRTVLAFSASSDGGRTWRAPVLIQDSNADAAPGKVYALAIDQSWIVVDNGSGAGHHHGRIYVTWIRREPTATGTVLAAFSDDKGATWQQGPAGAGFVVIPAGGFKPVPVVVANGDLAVIATAEQPQSLATAVVLDAPQYESQVQQDANPITISVARGAGSATALSFSEPQAVAIPRSNGDAGQSGCDCIAAVADTRGRIILAWTDTRFRSNFLGDLVVTTSNDEGATWSTLTRANHDDPSDWIDRFGPMIAVTRDGTIYAGYRKRQGAQGDPGDGSTYSRRVDTIVQTSTDGGRSFGAETLVSTHPSDLGFAAVNTNSIVIGLSDGPFLGDYAQMAGGERTVYVSRAEPLRVSALEESTMPPTYHHQRIWVAALQRKR